MKDIFKKITMGMAMVASFVLLASAFMPTTVNAACDAKNGLKGSLEKGCTNSSNTPDDLTGSTGVIPTVINTMLFIVGILSVIMIIYAGIRYVTAHGDKNQVEGANNTLIYAIVGLVIAILAYALVNWVTGVLMKK